MARDLRSLEAKLSKLVDQSDCRTCALRTERCGECGALVGEIRRTKDEIIAVLNGEFDRIQRRDAMLAQTVEDHRLASENCSPEALAGGHNVRKSKIARR